VQDTHKQDGSRDLLTLAWLAWDQYARPLCSIGPRFGGDSRRSVAADR